MNTVTPRGAVSQETLGNGVKANRTFDAVTGWLSLQTFGPTATPASLPNPLTENFYYDNLYRFDYSTLKVGAGSPATNLDVNYDPTGNISSRSDVASGAAWTHRCGFHPSRAAISLHAGQCFTHAGPV